MKKGYGGLGRLVRWRRSFPLLSMPLPLIGYVLSVLACYLVLFGWEAARTPQSASDLALFAALTCCGAICIEATRRLGQPAGVTRDLLSAWWLPVALLLPPVYALAAPAVLGLLCYVRVRRGPVYRRVFSSAALGLAGAATSAMFRALSLVPQDSGWLTTAGRTGGSTSRGRLRWWWPARWRSECSARASSPSRHGSPSRAAGSGTCCGTASGCSST